MVGFDWICHGNGTACSVIDGIANRERGSVVVLVTLPVNVTSRKRRLHPLPSLSVSLCLFFLSFSPLFNFLFFIYFTL